MMATTAVLSMALLLGVGIGFVLAAAIRIRRAFDVPPCPQCGCRSVSEDCGIYQCTRCLTDREDLQ